MDEVTIPYLEVLYDGSGLFEGGVIDVVAVHGFNGHSRRSLTSESPEEPRSTWLEELLSQNMPNARVMLFKYNCHGNGEKSLLSAGGLAYAAEALLAVLDDHRADAPYHSRPLIFLAHDLGGIVVKKALVIASRNRRFSSIIENARRLLFFGTPHRASNLVSWNDLVYSIVSATHSLPTPIHDLPRRVRLFSKALAQVVVDFNSMITSQSLVNIYQQYCESRVDGGGVIVNHYSATTGFVYETNIGQKSSHQNLCRFSEADPDFLAISKALKQDSDQDYVKCCSTLLKLAPSFPVPAEVRGGLEVMEKHQGIEAFLKSETSSIIYLHDHQGVDGSVFSGTLFRYLQRLKRGRGFVTYYSFSGSDVRQTTSTSLLSSLIYQLLSQDPARFRQVHDLSVAIEKQSSWTPHAFWIFFRALIMSVGLETLYCVINEIHHCDSSWLQLFKSLLVLQATENMPTKFKIILIGQERQDFKDFFNTPAEVPLDSQVFFTMSLQSQRTQMIAELIEERPFLLEFEKRIEDALDQCESLFQLSLNVHVLRDSSHDLLSNRKSIRSHIQRLPYNVSGLVSKAFQTLPEWAKKALGWMLHAQRPMKVTELAAAIALVDNGESVRLDENDLLLDLPMDLESVFGPLIKVENNEARFSHEQVKHCFQQAVKGGQEPTDVGVDQSHDVKQQKIRLVCDWDITCILLKYLQSEEIFSAAKKAPQEDTWEEPQNPIFYLMQYAVQFWPEHYRKAQQQGSHAKELLDLLRHQDTVQVWSKPSCKFGSILSPSDLYVIDPFCLGALFGFADIVDLHLEQETGKSVTPQTYTLALGLASWAGHLDVVTKLVDKDLGNDSEILSSALEYASSQGHEEIEDLLIGKLPKPTQDLSWDPALLCRVAELGYQALVSMFMTAGADVNATHEGTTPLQLAARNGHEEIVANLLLRKADPNSTSAKESSKAIHFAASKGYTAAIEHLLKFHADVGVTDHHGHTALHLASRNGHQRIVKLLLEQHPHVIAQDHNGQTALHLASFSGHAETAKLLAQGKRESEIDIQDTLGNTPLSLASKNGHLSVVELLLDKGAKIDLTNNEEGSGHTALYHATSNGHEAIAERILRATTEETSWKDITEVLLQAAKQGFDLICELCIRRIPSTDLDSTDNDGCTALHYAAESGHVDIVSLLIRHGATVDPKTNRNGSPLALAACAGRGRVVRFLLAAGADALARVDNRNLASQVALISSKTDGHADAVQALVKAGVDIHDVDIGGYSALHHAARNGNVKVARVLLNRGADPVLRDDLFWTPLHHAACGNRTEVVQLFIDHGVDLLVSDSEGLTSMHLAKISSCLSVMEVLWKADPTLLSRRSNDRRTPLHFAHKQTRSTEWLLAHSVDIDAVTESGMTALMLSAENGDQTVVGLLLSHNASVSLRDNSQKTALHYSAKRGHILIAKKILGKDHNTINGQDDDGYSALHTAICENQPDIVRMLLEEGLYININLKDARGNTLLLLAVQERLDDVVGHLLGCQAETELRNQKGETALLLAIKVKSESTLKTLLQSPDHVKVNGGGGVFPTALHMAAGYGELAVVDQLLENGADVNAEGGLYNTALQAAAANGFEDVVKHLLNKGADASLGGGLFANVLSAAVFSKTFDIVPMLHERKADINAQDDQGRTAVHLAAWRGSADNIQWLIDRDGDISVKDRQGRTVVHHAAMAGSPDMMKMLMQDEKWVSLNVGDIDRWTPLHWACRSDENDEIIKLLIDDEASISKETKYGWTPVSIAIFHGASELLPLLAPALKEPASKEVLDSLEEKHPQQPTQTLKKKTWRFDPSQISRQYNCDGCQQFPIHGRRWHCTECEDFNFCFKCSWSPGITHPGHRFEGKGQGPETGPEYEADSD